MMRALASSLLTLTGLLLVGTGATGVFSAPWELARFGCTGFATTEQLRLGDFMSDYRAAKAINVAFGIFVLLFRRDILDGAPPFLLFLAASLLATIVRADAWWSHGAPSDINKPGRARHIATLVAVVVYRRRYRGSLA